MARPLFYGLKQSILIDDILRHLLAQVPEFGDLSTLEAGPVGHSQFSSPGNRATREKVATMSPSVYFRSSIIVRPKSPPMHTDWNNPKTPK